MSFFDKHSGYKRMKKDVISRYGSEITNKIWKDADELLDKLREAHSDHSKALKRHTHDNIFPRVAMYQAMMKDIPEDAMPLLKKAVEDTCSGVNKLLSRLVKIPGMPSVFLRAMSTFEKKLFGPAVGFNRVFYADNKKELHFDILKCPYCQYCEKCGCPELSHTFCDSDVYCYGNLPNIVFNRTETIGTGGKRCDFYFAIDKSK